MPTTFNFHGDNLTAADPEHGTETQHDNTQFTENGVTFFYSSNVDSFLASGGFDPGGNQFGPAAIQLGDGTGTLLVGNTDPSNAFLSDIVLEFEFIAHDPNVGTVNVVFSNTVNDTQQTITLPTGTEIGGVAADTNPPLLVTAPAGMEFNKIVFQAPNAPNGIVLHSVTATPTCVLAGTCFTRADGAQVAVEALQPGDRIRTETGTTTVKWVGQQFIDTRLTHPARVNPICIRAGALGEGLPARDVLVSADHAIGIDGILVNAGALVNGHTIHRVAEMPRAGFTYYHVETDAHELLLTEGIGVESFIDYVGREGFDNAPPALSARIPEMKLPRVSAQRILPAALRARLAARAKALTDPAAA